MWHYYAFSNITFHAVCHVAVVNINFQQIYESRQCTINKVIVFQKNKLACNRLNESSGIRFLFCYGCTSQSNTFAKCPLMTVIHALCGRPITKDCAI